MNTFSKPQIIGVSGTFASGKDTVAAFLEQDFGYTHVSTGDIVRRVAMEKYGSLERPVLLRTADELRRSEGAGALALEALKASRPLVITGVRSLGEAKTIQQAGGVIVFVDAPAEVRYERMRARARDNETVLTLEQFRANEEKEMYSGSTDADFNIRGIGELADVIVTNDGSLEDYKNTVYTKLGLAS